MQMNENAAVRTIYTGRYVPDLGIWQVPGHPMFGWLCYKHPDGQWVSLADLKPHIDLISLAGTETPEQLDATD